MNWLDQLTQPSVSQAEPQRIYGVVIALVTNNQDPKNLGRIKIKFPWLSDQVESDWTRIAFPMAGKDRGFYCLPELGDEVLVAFEQGDPAYPYVIGSLWNGIDKPPQTNSDGKNDIRMIKSRSGHMVRFNDKPGEETIEIIDKTANNKITFNATRNVITIQSDRDIELSAPNGAIKLKANQIAIEANTTLEAKAQAEMKLKADGVCTIQGSLINLN